MCLSPFKVKSKNPYNVSMVTVPCGRCAECRARQRNQWQTRLFAEMDEYHARKGWNVGFVTLTYQESCLPTIPESFFKPGEYERIPCFSYQDIKKFTDTIRNYFQRKRRWTNAFRFFITCEYGEKNHRPHYHGILLFTSRISHEEMFKIVEDAWCGSSQVIPQPRRKALRRKPLGIVGSFDSFVPRDVHGTGAYVAKYVCKDIEFEDTVSGKFGHLTRKARNHLRHFCPFHKQSIGFGSCLIKGKSTAELCDMLDNGVQFYGESRMTGLPLYLKNKILFNNRTVYNLRAHRFETVKTYTKFLHDNRALVWNRRFLQAKEMFKLYATDGYWQTHMQVSEDFSGWTPERVARNCRSVLEAVGLDDLAYFYCTYYGIRADKCHAEVPPEDLLVSRYDPCADLSDFPLVDPFWHRCMTMAVNDILLANDALKTYERRTALEQEIAEIRAFFNM